MDPSATLTQPAAGAECRKAVEVPPSPTVLRCCDSRSVTPARRRAGDSTWLCKRPRLPGPAWLLGRHCSHAPTASGQPVHLQTLQFSGVGSASAPSSHSPHYFSLFLALCRVCIPSCRACHRASHLLDPSRLSRGWANLPGRWHSPRAGRICRRVLKSSILGSLHSFLGLLPADGAGSKVSAQGVNGRNQIHWNAWLGAVGVLPCCRRAAVPHQQNASSGCSILANATPLPHTCR